MFSFSQSVFRDLLFFIVVFSDGKPAWRRPKALREQFTALLVHSGAYFTHFTQNSKAPTTRYTDVAGRIKLYAPNFLVNVDLHVL